MRDLVAVTDRPAHPPLANPLPRGVYEATLLRCPTCGVEAPIVCGVFQHRCRLVFD